MALGRLSSEQFKRGPRNFTTLSGTVSPTNLPVPDMTSLAASGQLQNATEYGTKVRKTGAAGIEMYKSVMV